MAVCSNKVAPVTAASWTAGLAVLGALMTLPSGCSHARVEPTAQVPAIVQAPGDTQQKIAWALQGAWRSPAAKARDAARHPAETLSFFGLRDDMHVVEISPGGGWYTAILAPVLADRGRLTITGTIDDLQRHPDVFGRVVVLPATPPGQVAPFGPEESADMVLTFRNMHNWVSRHNEDAVLAAAFRVLKHGGVFGLTDHRAAAQADPTKPGDGGYLREDWVVATVEKAGFRLAAKSEVNANPRDTKDYPRGVWTLPPSYALAEVDHAKYQAIGESDRMTLRFVKP